MTKIGTIVGSTRPGRRGPTVALWVAAAACEHPDADFEIVDLADFALPAARRGAAGPNRPPSPSFCTSPRSTVDSAATVSRSSNTPFQNRSLRIGDWDGSNPTPNLHSARRTTARRAHSRNAGRTVPTRDPDHNGR